MIGRSHIKVSISVQEVSDLIITIHVITIDLVYHQRAGIFVESKILKPGRMFDFRNLQINDRKMDTNSYYNKLQIP